MTPILMTQPPSPAPAQSQPQPLPTPAPGNLLHFGSSPLQQTRAKDSRQARLVMYAAMLLLAAIARGVALYIAARQFSPQWLFTRGREMGYLATSLLNHEGLSSPFGYQAGHTGSTALIGPAYPLFVAAAFRVFGSYSAAAAVAIFIVQAIVSVATVALVMRLAERIGGARHGRRAALVSGLVWACSPPLLWMPTILWDTTFTTFLVTAMVLFALRFRERCAEQGTGFVGNARRLRLVQVCAAYGASCLINPALLPLALIMGAWLSFYAIGAERFRSMALALVTVVAVFSPWPIRNAVVMHSFIPMRSTAGLELWMGNHPGADGHMEESMFPVFNPTEMAEYLRVGEVHYGQHKTALAQAWIGTHHTAFASLTLTRIFRFWTGTGTRGGSWAFWAHAVPTWLLGLVGLVLLVRHRHRAATDVIRRTLGPGFSSLTTRNVFLSSQIRSQQGRGQVLAFSLPLLIFPLPYFVSHAEFRYRLTIDPLLTALTGYTLARLYSRARQAWDRRHGGQPASIHRNGGRPRSPRHAHHDSRHAAAMSWTSMWRSTWRSSWRQRSATSHPRSTTFLACESGQTIIVAALSLTALIAFMGLAVDVGHLRLERRHLQAAADAAALSAGLEFNTCGTINACTVMQTAAQKALAENGYTAATTVLACGTSGASGVVMTLNNGPCAMGAADPNAANRAFVEVELAEPVNTYFAQIVGFNHVPVSVRAEAGKAAQPCIYALDRTPLAVGITVAAGTLQADCGIVDESNAPLTAFNCIAGSVTATKITVGGTYGLLSPAACTVTPAPQQNTPLPTPADPLAYVLQNNPIAPAATCTLAPTLGLTSVLVTGTRTLSPGTYCGGLTIAATANVTFLPGVYVLTNSNLLNLVPLTGGLTIAAGATVQGTGVTFYNTNTAALPNALGGYMLTASGAVIGNVDLEASTSGPYAGLLFMQSLNDTAPSTIIASPAIDTKLVGGFYLPGALVTYAVAGNARFNILVAKDIVFGVTTGATAYETSVFGNDYSQLSGNVSPVKSGGSVMVQ